MSHVTPPSFQSSSWNLNPAYRQAMNRILSLVKSRQVLPSSSLGKIVISLN
ncbi:MAG: hypothetical protein O3C46_07000 [Bacteroidetes bacterium]|nr:hypothetical protein [Bacteroidota bacterium]